MGQASEWINTQDAHELKKSVKNFRWYIRYHEKKNRNVNYTLHRTEVILKKKMFTHNVFLSGRLFSLFVPKKSRWKKKIVQCFWNLYSVLLQN